MALARVQDGSAQRRRAETDAAIRGLAVAVERAKAEVSAQAGAREADAEVVREMTQRALAAEARVRQLEWELNLVIERAEAFEYGVRMAVFDAFKLVRSVSDRVGTLLGRTPLGELPKLLTGRSEDGGAEGPEPRAPEAWPPPGSALEAERLDAALERLRAASEPRPDDA